MKATETATVNGYQLTVLCEADEHNKAYISYFVNGDQLGDWNVIKPLFQDIFTALADELCRRYNLTKWSY